MIPQLTFLGFLIASTLAAMVAYYLGSRRS